MRVRIPKRPSSTLWDHNGHYHDYLLRRLPAQAGRALDVGCGTGVFARRLAERAESVDAVDVSPQMIAAARAGAAGMPNVRWLLGDVLTLELEAGGYDIVTAIASVHHLPLAAGLARLASVVRPGGSLAILGLYREAALSDYVAGALAIPVDTAVGIGKAARRTLGKSQGSSPAGPTAAMPVRDPSATLRQVRAEARRLMPGARIHRHLFYRYSLLWQRPERF